MKATVDAEEAQLFCSCVCEIRFKRRKVRWRYLTAVFTSLQGDYSRREGKQMLIRGVQQQRTAHLSKTMENVRATAFISVLALDCFFTLESSAMQYLVNVPWLTQPAGSSLTQAASTVH